MSDSVKNNNNNKTISSDNNSVSSLSSDKISENIQEIIIEPIKKLDRITVLKTYKGVRTISNNYYKM
jgi:hypothetical protein